MATVIMLNASAFLTLFYLGLMGVYRRGWKRLRVSENNIAANPEIFVSIIIPARNEEKNIENLLNALLHQDYPRSNYEIIVVDDHSEDRTAEIIKLLSAENPSIRLVEMSKTKGKRYKKAAITEGIKVSKGEIVVTTDADCVMGNHWLSTVVAFFGATNAALVSGPVVFSTQKSFFHKILQLEFAGLVGIGAAALRLKSPNMCNGANLAYRKDIFNEVDGYTGNDNLPSGDDEFLMHKVFEKYPESVFFLKNREAVVETPPPATFGEFLNQRMRWVSKSTQYSDKKITLLLALAYLFNLSMLVNGLLAFTNILFLYVFIIQVAAKVCIEYLLYGGILEFFNLKSLKKYIIAAQPFHIAYVLAIGILGNFGKYSWKGRKQ